MRYKILFKPEALFEIEDAYEWYEAQKEHLGDDFIKELQECYNNLLINPQRYSYINNVYRRIKTDRFPYILVYEISHENIIIYSVRHTKRKPL